jgi:hypothetical protein
MDVSLCEVETDFLCSIQIEVRIKTFLQLMLMKYNERRIKH